MAQTDKEKWLEGAEEYGAPLEDWRKVPVVTEDEIDETMSIPGVKYSTDPSVSTRATPQGFVQLHLGSLFSKISGMEGDVEEAIQDAETAAGNANTAAGVANSAAENAETSRQRIEANEQTRQSNEQTRQQQESAREQQAQGDHVRAEGDHSTATQDHTQAGQDHSRAESDHSTASADHTTAGQEHTRSEQDHTRAEGDHSRAEQDHTASEAATTAATNVNADLTGMTVTITNRQGISKSVNIGFEILEDHVYPTLAAMNADAANVRAGQFCMIATTDPTSPDNAQLWSRNSSAATSEHPFTFLSDLDQASSAAWADWLDNMKPQIEADHTRAATDHTTATQDHTSSVDATSAANTAANLANEKAQYAAEQGDYSKNMADHPAYIGEDNYWYIWNYAQQKYVKSSYAKGDDLDWESMTEEEKQALADEVLSRIAFDSKPTPGSSNTVTSGGIYTALGNREKIIEASVATSQSIVDELT